uniref:Odorant receptor n=1 Tax=Grapholita molesta TaxID=192188 RepID=A0A9Y1ISG8_GRAMO|nr:odorant-receptor-8 [Grapholita molesta]
MTVDTRLPTDALDADYMKATRLYLNTIAHWPHEIFGPRTMRTRLFSIYHRIMLTSCVCIMISEIILARYNSETHDLFYMGQDYLNILIMFVMIARSTLILQKKYRTLIHTFVTKFHLEKFKNASEFAAQEHRWITKICRAVTIVMLIQCLIGPVMFNVVPIYQTYQAGMFNTRQHRPLNSTFTHSVNYFFILDQYKDMPGYITVFILNLYISYICAALFCGLDLLIYIMVFHIMGHINILVNRMKTFPRPKKDDEFSPEHFEQYNEEASKILKDLIKYDVLIKDSLDNTSGTFGLQLCICLFYHQVSGCICLLEISPMTPEALGRYIPLTIIMYNQLIQMSIIFELIASKSDSIPDEVYGLPWELMDARNRRTVLVFLRNAQRGKALKAGGLVPVGVITMSSIIKNSLSYFIILKTLGSN